MAWCCQGVQSRNVWSGYLMNILILWEQPTSVCINTFLAHPMPLLCTLLNTSSEVKVKINCTCPLVHNVQWQSEYTAVKQLITLNSSPYKPVLARSGLLFATVHSSQLLFPFCNFFFNCYGVFTNWIYY